MAKESFDRWWAIERKKHGTNGFQGVGQHAPVRPRESSWCSDDTWAKAFDEDVPEGRHLHATVWTGTEMVIWGGYGGSYLKTGSRYDPSTDTWAATSTGAGVPSSRGGHTGVWTGTEMVVWGGYGGSYLNSGGRYNPSTDTWAARSRRGTTSVVSLSVKAVEPAATVGAAASATSKSAGMGV